MNKSDYTKQLLKRLNGDQSDFKIESIKYPTIKDTLKNTIPEIFVKQIN